MGNPKEPGTEPEDSATKWQTCSAPSLGFRSPKHLMILEILSLSRNTSPYFARVLWSPSYLSQLFPTLCGSLWGDVLAGASLVPLGFQERTSVAYFLLPVFGSKFQLEAVFGFTTKTVSAQVTASFMVTCWNLVYLSCTKASPIC